MKLLLVIVLSILLLKCEIKKNPLAPNGPFGIFTLLLNLSKIGEWSYTDSKVIYYSLNEPIPDNVPIFPQGLKNVLTISEPLTTGLSFNTSTGVISGTPTVAQAEKEYKFFANYNPLPNRPENVASLKISIGDYALSSGINVPFSFSSPFPTPSDFTNYTISPSLPTGVSLDANSGVISGQATTSSKIIYRLKAIRKSDNVSYIAYLPIQFTEWVNEAYLKAPNVGASDNFGQSVSIDADTIAVGANLEDSNQTTITNGLATGGNNPGPSANQGAAYVYRRTGSTWTNEAYLKAPNAETVDQFGDSVSISGDTVVVGATREDSTQTTITNGTLLQATDTASNLSVGAVYVFRRSGVSWANEAYLKAPNAEGLTGGTGDQFGFSVSILGDTIIVGASQEDSNQTTITNGTLVQASDVNGDNSGAAYVFRRTGTTWANEAYLKAPNADASDRFGSSVSISGDTIVVGSIIEDSNQTTITNGLGSGGNNPNLSANQGAAYVFRRNGTTWTNEAYLKAPNAESNDQFGSKISISGDTIVVAAMEEDSLQTTITNGTLIQTSDVISDLSVGAVYVFKRTGNTWSNEAYLKAPNAEGLASASGDFFGISVSISGDTIVVGANQEDSLQTTITNGTLIQASDVSTTNSGAVYVFKRTGSTWANEAYLKAPNAESSDQFGISVSISGDTIVVGARYEASNQTTITNGLAPVGINGATQSGAAYVFRRK